MICVNWLLSQDGRMSFTDLGKATGLSTSAAAPGTPVTPRVVSLLPVACLPRCPPGGTTSLARPTKARNRIVSQVLSISHQRWPCRAERGSAWWLLCQPSPFEISPTTRLLRLSSSVS